MAAISGKSGVVKLGANDQLKVTAWDATDVVDQPDSTGMSDGGFADHATGIQRFDFTFTAFLSTAANGTPPRSGDEVAFELHSDAVPRLKYSGNARFGTVRPGVPVEGNVAFTGDAKAYGEVTKTET